MRNLFLIIGLYILPALAEETLKYTVYFWKIPCVDITMTLNDDTLPDYQTINFTTRTKDIISYFFSVDNFYKTEYDPKTFQLLKYEKKIKQTDIDQKLKIEWNDENNSFQSGKINYKREGITHNIFTLFMRGRSMTFDSLDTKWWKLDHEGKLFNSRYIWIDSVEVDIDGDKYLTDHYRLDLIRQLADNEPTQLVEKTDIFTWGIALDDCVRQIWIERGGKKRILRAEVKVSGFTLIAELKNE